MNSNGLTLKSGIITSVREVGIQNHQKINELLSIYLFGCS